MLWKVEGLVRMLSRAAILLGAPHAAALRSTQMKAYSSEYGRIAAIGRNGSKRPLLGEDKMCLNVREGAQSSRLRPPKMSVYL